MMSSGKESDLGLSLSLGFTHTHQTNTMQLNLMPSVAPPSSSGFGNIQKPSWNETFTPTSYPNETRTFLKGIDVNRIPTAIECEDDQAGISSPNTSTVSSVMSGKRTERENNNINNNNNNNNGDDLELERASSSRGNSDEEDGDNSRKKLRLSKDQSAVLEESFKEHHTLNPKQKMALAKQLGLRPRQVEVWFQNRRARTKLKQTEVDCEFLKRCCENLTEENRRLQKEVQELRALKLSPQFYMQMTPPTTLTMCPSCERVGVPPQQQSSSPTVDPRGHHHHRPIPWGPSAAPVTHHGPFPRS